MPEYGYRLQFAPRVARVMGNYSIEEQEQVERIFWMIQIDPVPDPATKVVLVVPPAVFTVHYSEGFWVVYHIDGYNINIVNVGRAPDEAHFR